jgi:hypothetical protein
MIYLKKDRLLNWEYRTVIERGQFLDVMWSCYRREKFRIDKEGSQVYFYSFVMIRNGKKIKTHRQSIETYTDSVARYIIRRYDEFEVLYEKYNKSR